MVGRPYVSFLTATPPAKKHHGLNYDGYPHIIELIVLFSGWPTQIKCRLVSRDVRNYVDRLSVRDGILFEHTGKHTPCNPMTGQKLPVFSPTSHEWDVKDLQRDVMRRVPRITLGGGATLPHAEELLAYLPETAPMTIVHDTSGPAFNMAIFAPIYLDIDTVIRCQCSRNMPEAVFVHAATHLTVHLTAPLLFGNEGETACSLLRGLWQPTVQVLQLCFEEPDWPFAALIPALFPEPVVHPNLKIRFHFAWWAAYNVIETTKAVRSLLANHFGIDIRRVEEVITVRPFPTLPKVTCAHSPERPYSH